MNGIHDEKKSNGNAAAFGSALRQLREGSGLSLAALAAQTHYSRGHLSNVENGSKTPSTELARACDDVLRSNGHLQSLVPPPAYRSRAGLIRPAQLPAGTHPFIGRAGLLSQLDGVLREQESSNVIALYGATGIGKTTLAVHWAHQVSAHYPDGTLYACLSGRHLSTTSRPADLLANWMRELGVPDNQVPATLEQRAARWRSMLHQRRMLLVLDDAVSVEQIRPLLPGGPTCTVVVASRERLAELSIYDGAHSFQVEPLTPAEALSMLRNLIGAQRVDIEPRAAASIAAHCAHLPGVLRATAEYIRVHPLRTVSDLAADMIGNDPEKELSAPRQSSDTRWRHQPSGVDLTEPSVGRVYNYYVGGATHYRADREFGRCVAELFPDVSDNAASNQRFLARAIQFCARRGITQFMDLGAGVPGSFNSHDAARTIDPTSRVVYVDNELVTVETIRQHIYDDRSARVIRADLRDVEEVLHHPTTASLIDRRQPLALIMGLVLHFVPDIDDPADILSRYRRAIPAGSYVIVSHNTADGREPEISAVTSLYRKSGLTLVPRTRDELANLLAGFALIQPGIVRAPLWRPDSADQPVEDPDRNCIYVAVAQTGAS